MQTPTRREFHKQALGSLVTFSLLETLFQHDLFADDVKPLTTRWLVDVHQLGLDLKDEKLQQSEWQTKIEELFAKVDLADLLRLIDFDKLTKDIKLVDEGALSLRFKFPEVEGLPKSLVFGKQIFALKRDRSVVPHGHNNMATAFLILKGDLQSRPVFFPDVESGKVASSLLLTQHGHPNTAQSDNAASVVKAPFHRAWSQHTISAAPSHHLESRHANAHEA